MTVLKHKAALDQFCKGLATLGVLAEIENNPARFEKFFVHSKEEITAGFVKGLLKPARVSTPDSDKALEMFYTFTDKADHQGLSEFLSFTNGELQSSRPKVISPKTRVMSPEIHSHVVRYFESCCPKFDNAEKDSGCSFRCCFHGDSKPKIKYEIKKTTVCSNISYSMVLTVVFIC